MEKVFHTNQNYRRFIYLTLFQAQSTQNQEYKPC